MIYFEFAIRPDAAPGLTAITEFETSTAEFMFESDDPADCTRRAAAVLQSKGWRPVHVKHAREAFKREDFSPDEQTTKLFHEAQNSGMGFRLGFEEPAVTATATA